MPPYPPSLKSQLPIRTHTQTLSQGAICDFTIFGFAARKSRISVGFFYKCNSSIFAVFQIHGTDINGRLCFEAYSAELSLAWKRDINSRPALVLTMIDDGKYEYHRLAKNIIAREWTEIELPPEQKFKSSLNLKLLTKSTDPRPTIKLISEWVAGNKESSNTCPVTTTVTALRAIAAPAATVKSNSTASVQKEP